MADMLATAANWLAGVHKASAGQSVVYQRQSDFVSVTAVIGGSAGTSVDAGGVPYAVNSVDFLIKASDLVLSGETIEPQRGDRIVWNSCVYVVTADNAGERPFRESGPGRTVWRIYAKYKGAE